MSVIFIMTKNKVTFKDIREIIFYILYSHIYIIAVYLALVELIKKPFIWNKTTHNRSIYN